MFFACAAAQSITASASSLRVLNFQDDNGFRHKSMSDAKALMDRLGKQNGWEVISTANSSSLLELDLSTFDTIVFNNNCGNKGAIMTPAEQAAFRKYVQNGGGFLGVHGAGAIWKEGDPFQAWYEGLVGTKLIDHPKVQRARLVVEDRGHPATRHLPAEWYVVDEFHRFNFNPRENVNVLISVDESSYQGKQKMGGDHPFVWYHEYDGGRAFFTSLGHSKEIYHDPKFEQLIEGAILWTSGAVATKSRDVASAVKSPLNTMDLPVQTALLLDLDANLAVDLEDGNRVKAWHNQVSGNAADVFVKRDEGRRQKGSGRPTLRENVAAIGGNNTLIFEEQELVNLDEDAFDHLLTGNGYTWFSVMCVSEQRVGKKDVNSFFGNLRNGNPYEGFWGNVMDDNIVWIGSRNGFSSKGKKKKRQANSNGRGSPGLWDDTLNPCVQAQVPLDEGRYYLIMGRMGAGQQVVDLELFINSEIAVDRQPVPVNPQANPSKMAIGQERDAINHPGKESFHGEIARFLVYERPLSDTEMQQMIRYLTERYKIK
jgi:type 1 glutamine amidotransferase